MTDGPGQEPAPTDPEIDPELDAEIDAEINAVRALLGEARVTNPVPADVAARLDDVLAGLAAEGTAAERGAARRGATETAPPADGTPATVVPLRRRWAPRALVAAAAVVVLGGAAYGVGRVVHLEGTSSTSSAGSASSEATGRTAPPSASSASGARPTAPSTLAAGALPALRSAHFASDAARSLRGSLLPLTTGRTSADARTQGQKAAPSPSLGPEAPAPTACPGPAQAGTASGVVRLDGHLAALVVHPPRGGTRLVQAWSCDGRTLLAAARLPVG